MTRKAILEKTIDFDDAINRIVRLEKENSELKTRLNAINLLTSELQKASNLRKQQLTKAKEHIENLLYYVKQCTCERSNYAEIEKDIKEAEQFISEVEK